MILYNHLYGLAFGLYAVGSLSYAVFFVAQKGKIGAFSFFVVQSGFFLHTLSLIIRAVYLKYPPISNLYESLSFFAWMIMLVYILVQHRQKVFIDATFVLPLVVLLTGITFFLDSRPRPLLPALKSYWLGIHGFFCFLSYACFALAFVFGIMYLLQEREVKYKKIDALFFRLPSLEHSDRMGYQAVAFGFLSLTLGIITGSIWAQKAWGSFWSWDPKEVWSLIMWLVYLAYLHGRLMHGWQGRKSAYLAIAGFLVMFFTYLGASLFLGSLHSYL